jgi:hypothetical protein
MIEFVDVAILFMLIAVTTCALLARAGWQRSPALA